MKCSMHLDGVDEGFEPRKKRRCRSSKKKRLRLKQRTSLEPQEHESQWDRSENNQPLEKETKSKNDNQVTEQTQHQDTQVEREDEHEGKERQEEEHDHDERLHNNDDGVTAYERKRRENILRNQVWMQQLGFSSAKLAIRTAICSEATKKETDEAKRQKAAEMQARRAAQLAERQTQPLRKSRRVQRTTEVMMDTRKSRRIQEMTEAMKVREARRVQFSRKLADNARSRRLRERNSQKLANLQEKSRIDNDNDESDTEDDGAVEDLADERSRKGSNIEGFTSENCTKEDKMKDPSYESGEYDSRPMALVQLASPPHRLLLEPEIQPSRVESPVQLQNLDSFGNRPPTEGNQHETNQVQTSSVLQDDGETQTHRSMTQTSKHEPLSDNSMLGDMAEFERKRRENILRNQSFMQLVGVSIAKLAARTPIGDGAGKEAKRQELAAKLELKAARKAELLNQPVRKSRRTIGPKVVLGHPTALSYSMELLAMKTRNRSNVNFMDAMDDDGQAFLKEMASNPKKQNALTTNSIDDAVEYSLAKDDVVKALPFRTTAMAFLPRADRILLACGDKEGHISLWSPSTRANESTLSSAVLCRPHGFTVSQIIFPDSSTLLSSSVDGTVRELDLHTTKSSLVCDICGETGISSLIGSSNPQFYYAGCSDGSMRLIDRRTPTLHGGLSYDLHNKRINTLEQHPSLDYCMVTASDDRTVCFWDKRRISPRMSVPLTTISHATKVECAHFSPDDGNWLVTVTSENSLLNMFATSILTTRQESDPLPIPIPAPVRAHHEGFSKREARYMHAAWDPKNTSRFAIGCVGTTSKIKIFSAYRPSRELTSTNLVGTHPVNIFHPCLELIASGSSCGRLSLWRGNSKE